MLPNIGDHRVYGRATLKGRALVEGIFMLHWHQSFPKLSSQKNTQVRCSTRLTHARRVPAELVSCRCRAHVALIRSSECGTDTTVKARFWPYLSGKNSPQNAVSFSVFAKRGSESQHRFACYVTGDSHTRLSLYKGYLQTTRELRV